MEVQSDFRELLALLNEHKVDYIIIGAYALAFQGVRKGTAALCPYKIMFHIVKQECLTYHYRLSCSIFV